MKGFLAQARRIVIIMGMASGNFFIVPDSEASQNNGDSLGLDTLLANFSNATASEKAAIFNKIAEDNFLDNPRRSLAMAKQGLNYAEESGDMRLVADAQRFMGGALFYLSDISEAIHYFSLSLETAKEAQYAHGISASLNNLGLAFSETGNYGLALEYLLESLNNISPSELPEDYSITLNNIGKTYMRLNDSAKAHSYLSASLNMKSKLGLEHRVPYSMVNLGDLFLKLSHYDSAEYYFNTLLSLPNNQQNRNNRAAAFFGLARVYDVKGDEEAALNFLKRSQEIRRRIGDKAGQSAGYYTLSQLYMEEGNPDLAMVYVDSSLNLSKTVGLKDQLVESFRLKAQLALILNKPELASEMYELALAYKDSIFNSRTVQNVRSLKAQYEVQQMRQENEMQRVELAFDRKLRIIFFVISFLSLALAFVIYNRYKLKQKSHDELWERNDQVIKANREVIRQKKKLEESNQKLTEAQQIISKQFTQLKEINQTLENLVEERTKALNESNKQLQWAVKELDNFIYKTSHDIRGPLARLKGLNNVALLDVSDPKAREYFELLDRTASMLDNILSRLMTINMIKNIALNPQPVEILPMVQDIIAQCKDIHPFQYLKVILKIESGMYIFSERNLLQLILFNLIENAIKFQQDREEGFVKICATTQDGNLEIRVADNGNGIENEYHPHIFDMFVKASKDAENVGLGLFLTKLSVEKLNGQIILAKADAEGTEFVVSLPLIPEQVSFR